MSRHTHEVHVRESGRGESAKDYLPLVVIVLLSAFVGAAKQVHYGEWRTDSWMLDFMGVFLVIFSAFKFFDLKGFADGFGMYDLLAKRFRPYAFLYPFLELALGLGYLARLQLPVVLTATIALMGFGTLGVIGALRRGLDVNCACMGTALRVPLSSVALLEDLGMAAMAAVMLTMRMGH
ncbi:MAG TPA: MauE/DoxX family redox-associated membrane protein [Luteolibacter sp.]